MKDDLSVIITNKMIDDILLLREYRLKNLSLQVNELLKETYFIWN